MNAHRDLEEDTFAHDVFPMTLINPEQMNNIISHKGSSRQNSLPGFDVEEHVSSNSHKYLINEMKNKFNLDQDKAEKILEFLKKSHVFSCNNSGASQPKFTLFGVQTVERGVAKNLAAHDNPFGRSDLKIRNKSRKLNRMGKSGRSPAWFDDFVTVL
jgi:hypothetical protein